MEQKEKIVNAIKNLTIIHLQIDDNGGPEENGELFDEYFRLRIEILSNFGLPDSDDFGKILLVKSIPDDKEIENIIDNLELSAIDYLYKPVKTASQILKEAIDLKLVPEKVLPEFGIISHIYTHFVYNEILLKKLDSALSVLDALKNANDPQVLNMLGIVALTKTFGEKENNMLTYLNVKRIKYLDQYLSAFQFNSKEPEIQVSQLAEFWHDLNGGFDFKSLEEKFETLTHYLMNYLCLMVGDKRYRIIETEMYYYDKTKHPDPYVHKAEEQLTAGNWYFNGFGLDITFGNKEKEIYGGMLIRGIKSLDENPQYFSGPSNVLKEIFSNIGNVIIGDNGLCLRELNKDVVKTIESEPIRSTRIGLTTKDGDIEKYAEKNYRYLVELNLQHKFKDKEKVVRQLLVDEKLTIEQSKEILGYNLNI